MVVAFKTLLKNGGTFFVIAQILSNFLNFLFNAYLGRELSFEDYGLVIFITSLLYLMMVVINAIATTVNHRVAFLNGQSNTPTGDSFYFYVFKKVLFFSFIAGLIWFLATPVLMKFFVVGEPWPILAFIPVFLFAMLTAVSKGFLQGRLFFTWVGLVLVIEASSKLLLALGLVFLRFNSLIYLSVPISLIISFLIIQFLISRKNLSNQNFTKIFPRRFFAACVISGLSTTAFLTLDILLVKHYLNPAIAGQYALLSLIGKMIFFFGSLFNVFIVTLVSQAEGQHSSTSAAFYKIFMLTVLAVTLMFLAVGPLGFLTVPLLFGAKANVIVPFLTVYGFAIALFTIANAFLVFHLVRHHYSFPFAAISMSAVMIISLFFYHRSIAQIVNVIFMISLINLILTLFLHLIYKNGRFILANLLDFFNLFSFNSFQETTPTDKRILIFNWRDTKHKYAGGAEVYIHELSKRWVKAGHQVTLFCGNDGASLRYELVDGVEVIRRGGFYFVYIWAFFYYLFKFKGKYEVIIDCQNGIPFFTPIYTKESVFCLMFHVHQQVFFTSLSRPMALVASFLENRAMPYVYKRTKFLTISESSKKEMEDWDIKGAGIEIIYPGIDLSSFKPVKKIAPNPLVVYVGRLKPYKSVNVFIETAKIVSQKFPMAMFVIAGNGEEYYKLLQLTKNLNIEKNVQFLGKISEKAKIKLYQKAWVFVNPSFMEGWGITTIEANACGTPVVASDVPGLRDSVLNPHTGFLVPHGNSTKFADKITLLIEDKKLREKMSKNSISWAQRFDWNLSAIKGLQLIS